MEQGITTRVPEVLEGLETFARRLEVTGLEVIQGGIINGVPPRDFLMIGVGWEDRPPAVEVEVSQESSGLTQKPIETVTVRSLLSTLSGDPELQVLDRYRWARDVVGGLDLALRQDPQLAGRVDSSWLGDELRYYAGQTPDGVVVSVAFETVHQAWL